MIDIDFYKTLPHKTIHINLKSNKKLISIIGESGSGKTTILKCLLGIENIDKGYIKIDNISYQNLPIQKRDIAIVFQNYALFPNMTVYENIKFALNNKKEIEKIMSLLEISHLKNKYPQNLSGGEKQRVAIARALIQKPKLLLLDEPFSALNQELKQKIYKEINIIKQFDTQIILVSHDINEVITLSDEIYKLDTTLQKYHINTYQGKLLEEKENFFLVKCNGKIFRINKNQ